MGKLGGGLKGLDKLKGYTDGFSEEDFFPVKEEKRVDLSEIDIAKRQKDSFADTQKDKKANIQTSKKAEKQISKPATGLKMVNANVPAEFKNRVGIYCAEHDIKENALIYAAVSAVIGYEVEESPIEIVHVPDSSDKAMLYGRYSAEFKTAAKLYEKKNKVTEADLVYSAVLAYMSK